MNKNLTTIRQSDMSMYVWSIIKPNSVDGIVVFLCWMIIFEKTGVQLVLKELSWESANHWFHQISSREIVFNYIGIVLKQFIHLLSENSENNLNSTH